MIENMYDAIRIVEPTNKKLISIKDDKIYELHGSCYDYWEKGIACSNCIAAKAYYKNITFAKIERNCSNTIIVMALPITINKDRYVVEMIKSIGEREKVFEINNDRKIVANAIAELFNIFYEAEILNDNTKVDYYFIEIDDDKILALENKIDELRDNLNKLCELPDKDNEILNISQALDKLIVEYMKKNDNY